MLSYCVSERKFTEGKIDRLFTRESKNGHTRYFVQMICDDCHKKKVRILKKADYESLQAAPDTVAETVAEEIAAH